MTRDLSVSEKGAGYDVQTLVGMASALDKCPGAVPGVRILHASGRSHVCAVKIIDN